MAPRAGPTIGIPAIALYASIAATAVLAVICKTDTANCLSAYFLFTWFRASSFSSSNLVVSFPAFLAAFISLSYLWVTLFISASWNPWTAEEALLIILLTALKYCSLPSIFFWIYSLLILFFAISYSSSESSPFLCSSSRAFSFKSLISSAASNSYFCITVALSFAPFSSIFLFDSSYTTVRRVISNPFFRASSNWDW